jgi:hypothetical protein
VLWGAYLMQTLNAIGFCSYLILNVNLLKDNTFFLTYKTRQWVNIKEIMYSVFNLDLDSFPITFWEILSLKKKYFYLSHL